MMVEPKNRAPKNKTIELDPSDIARFKKKLLRIDEEVSLSQIENKTIYQNTFQVLELLPAHFVDLVFVDPPYNMNKRGVLDNFQSQI